MGREGGEVTALWARNARALRISKGMSYRDVTRASEGAVAASTLLRAEAGDVAVSLRVAHDVALALGTTLGALLEE